MMGQRVFLGPVELVPVLPRGRARRVGALYLFQPLPVVPPTVPTEPVSTLRKNRHRAVCQPPRLPAPAARQLWDANFVGWAPIIRATSVICAAGTPQTRSASSGV